MGFFKHAKEGREKDRQNITTN